MYEICHESISLISHTCRYVVLMFNTRFFWAASMLTATNPTLQAKQSDNKRTSCRKRHESNRLRAILHIWTAHYAFAWLQYFLELAVAIVDWSICIWYRAKFASNPIYCRTCSILIHDLSYCSKNPILCVLAKSPPSFYFCVPKSSISTITIFIFKSKIFIFMQIFHVKKCLLLAAILNLARRGTGITRGCKFLGRLGSMSQARENDVTNVTSACKFSFLDTISTAQWREYKVSILKNLHVSSS